jgi:alkylhydroperoxidase family enzyme
VRSHTASAKRRGLSDAEIDAIGDPERWAATFPAEEIVLLDLATRLAHDSHDLGAELIERLRRHYDDRQLAEIVLVAGQANLNNRVGSSARQLFRPTAAS